MCFLDACPGYCHVSEGGDWSFSAHRNPMTYCLEGRPPASWPSGRLIGLPVSSSRAYLLPHQLRVCGPMAVHSPGNAPDQRLPWDSHPSLGEESGWEEIPPHHVPFLVQGQIPRAWPVQFPVNSGVRYTARKGSVPHLIPLLLRDIGAHGPCQMRKRKHSQLTELAHSSTHL